MSDELSASSWSSALQQEHRNGDGTTSTITRSQSFESVPRAASQQPQIDDPTSITSSQYPTQNVIDTPRQQQHHHQPPPQLEQIPYLSQVSVASPISPSQHNTLSKIMSVASSRFSRFTLGRDRDDDSSRAPSPFPEHSGRKSRFQSDHSIMSHNNQGNNMNNSSNNGNGNNNNSNNMGNNGNNSNNNSMNNMNKRMTITVPTTPTRGNNSNSTPVNVSTMIPASAVVEAQQKASTDDSDEALLELNQTLLEAIAANDWENYSALCDNDITCIEPDTQGHVLRGIAFHRYFFDKAAPELRHDINVLMTNAHVRRLGENSAVICYTRINQRLDVEGKPVVTTCNETRVWQKKDDGFWWNVHFHRS